MFLNMKHYVLGLAAITLAGIATAQDTHVCGTPMMRQRAIEQDPTFLVREAALEEELRQIILNNAVQRDDEFIITIPMVFHVQHLKGNENITDEQIFSAVNDLNDDFNALNNDLADVIAAFQPIIGNTRVEFKLATKDRFGNCTNGINRVQSVQTFLGESTSKEMQWPRDQYLNVWTCRNLPTGTAGYVNPPGSTDGFAQLLDGAMMRADYTGSTGISNSGRRHTLPHEMGHMFSLQHTWGGTNEPGVACGDDGVEDTPITAGSSGNCNLGLNNCEPGVIENVQNIMDYASCPKMFTQGQSARMRALLNTTSADRSSLWTEANLIATGVAPGSEAVCGPVADFYAVVGSSVTNPAVPFTPTTCSGTQVRFVDNSSRAFATEWSWTFQDATPSTSNVKNPTVNFNSPGWKSVTLTVSNQHGSSTKTDEYAVLIGDNNSGFNAGWYAGYEEGSNSLWPMFESNYHLNHTFFQVYNGPGAVGNGCVKLNSGDRNPFNLMNPDNVQDIDDLVSPQVNLSGAGTTYLNFHYSYSTRTSNLTNVTEKLEVFSSTDCGRTWSLRTTISGAALITNGNVNAPGNWQVRSLLLPQSVLTANTMFRFRFTSSAFSNDLFLDEFSVGGPVGITETAGNAVLNLYPNPTNDRFNLQVSGMEKHSTEVTILDLRGAVVYRNVFTPAASSGIELDGRALGLADGMYTLMVRNEAGSGATKLMMAR